MPISVHPDSDKRPMLPEGRYGLGGEAELTAITLRKVPGQDAAGYYIDFAVTVDDAAQGRIFLHSSPFGAFNTQNGPGAASVAKAFLASVGLPATAEFADEADENGNHALLGPNPCPCKVVVDVTYEQWTDKKSGQPKERNGLKSIARLG